METLKARSAAPTSGSLTMIAGPPGLGKSHFCGTMGEFLKPEEVLVIATLPREINSLKYQEYNFDYLMVTDEETWRPSDKKLGAQGFTKLTGILRDLRKDTKYAGIILDNGTEAAEMAWHSALEPHGVGDPGDLKGGNRYAPYTSMREKLEQMMRDLSILTGKTGFAARPKLIAVPWHIQPPKESQDEDDSADEKGRGSEYEGEFLPMIRGAFRRRVGALVDNQIYVDLVQVPKNPKNALSSMEQHYCIQVVSDRERHCKLAGKVPEQEQLLKGKYIDVHGKPDGWRTLMALLTPKSK
jgi:hypothetical protein